MPQFKGKNILVTAGPTWTKLDKVRVLTSVFSGQTGLEIARHFAKLGANVTLLMGPGRAKFTQEDWTTMDIKQFFYFEELEGLLNDELARNNFDVIFHSSAVSDFQAETIYNGKTPSKDSWQINLKPTKKLVDIIRTKAPKSFLVKFKLQVGLPQDELIKIAHNSLQESNADLIVANNLDEIDEKYHQAFVVKPDKTFTEVRDKNELCEVLGSNCSQ